jgi:DNA-binding NarL/FixJ family response regulator
MPRRLRKGGGRRRAPARRRWSRGAKAPPDVLQHRAARVLIVDDDADSINMPGLTGTDVLLAIRAVAPKATVIMISGTADADLAKRALAHGAFDYVVKRSMCVIWTRVFRRRSQ